MARIPSGTCLLLMMVTGTALAGQVTEDFSQATTGTTLGSCGQLSLGQSGGGSVTVSGNGVAQINTPQASDAAFIRSTAALPAGGYSVTITLKSIAYPKSAVENGVTLLAISEGPPTAGTESDWVGRRLVGVELDVKPDFVDNASPFVNYWDPAGVMYTWTGNQWGTGDDLWNPYFPSKSSYTVQIDRGATEYVIRVSSDGTQLTQAAVPIGSVRQGASEYLVVGDRLTDFFQGRMEVESITMPATCSGPDSGAPPATDGSTIGVDQSGLPATDGTELHLDAGAPYYPGRPDQPMACDCRLGQTPRAPGAGALVLQLLLTLWVCRRRQKKATTPR